MSRKVSADKLGFELESILSDYSDEVWEEIQDIGTKVAKEAANKLKNGSPNRTGDYAKGWKVKTQKGRKKVSNTVYNAKKPQLTHLLEWGHISAGNGRRVAARPHIQSVEEWANQEYERRVKEAIQK